MEGAGLSTSLHLVGQKREVERVDGGGAKRRQMGAAQGLYGS